MDNMTQGDAMDKKTDWFASLAEKMFAMGYTVLPSKGKRVLIENWSKMVVNGDIVKKWAGNGEANSNVSIRTGVQYDGTVLVGVDIDILELATARSVQADFFAKFGEAPVRGGMAPKRLILCRLDRAMGKAVSETWESADGKRHKVELLCEGQQFVAYGVHPDTGKPYAWLNGAEVGTPTILETWELLEVEADAMLAWLADLKNKVPADWKVVTGSREAGDVGVDAADRALANYKPKLGMTLEEAGVLVAGVDVECEYDDWLNVGMALSHEFDGSEEAFAIWDEHFSQSSKYVDGVGRYKWESFRNDPGRGRITTMATVISLSKAHRRVELEVELLPDWKQRINEAMSDEEIKTIMVEISDTASDLLDELERDALVGVIQAKLKGLGIRAKMSSIEKAIAPKKGTAVAGQSGAAPMEIWAEHYVWCVFENAFIDTTNQLVVSVMSFNAVHGRDVKGRWVTGMGEQMPAAHVALQELQVPVVQRRMYLPGADAVFQMDGVSFLNTYMPDMIPPSKPASEWSADEAETVELFKAHIKMLCRDDGYAYMLWYLAHNAQFPGKKIRHSPLLKGIQGDGKSLLGRLMEAAIGSANVAAIGPTEVATAFNGWAEGAAFRVVEEIRMVGHSRYDTLNSMKPVITNHRISINRKGKDPYNIVNVTNYLFLTNYIDALPLSNDDRRFGIIVSPFRDKEELKAATGGQDYFDRLFHGLEHHGAALRGWLTGIDLNADEWRGYQADGRAPETFWAGVMAATAHDHNDDSVADLIEEGNHPGVSKTIVSVNHLMAALGMSATASADVHAVTRSLAKLNYTKMPSQVWWKGKNRRCWTTSDACLMDKDKARAALDETVTDEADGEL